MDVVTKSVDAAVAPIESEHPNGSFEVVLSTESLDRDKEHLWANEWKQPLPERIHFDGDHGRSLDKTVGSAVPTFEGNKLVAKGTFAGTPYAQMVRQLVNEGHVNSVSVTFAEHKFQKNGDAAVNPTGVQRELLNAAFVAIPANPEAVVLASKAAKFEEKAAGGLSASGDNPILPKHDEMVQAIHDAACHLGAQCQNEIDADPGTADGANKSLAEATFSKIADKSSSPEAGSPQESAEKSAAAETAEKSAVSAAAEAPADDTAAHKAKQLERARGLAFLIKMNSEEL